MDFLKKIWNFLSMLPAFTNLFKKASTTGKINPVEALDALSTISPGTKKVADTAINEVKQGANIPDIAKSLENIGEIEVFGQKVNTQTMVNDLRRIGGICSIFANILDGMKKQTPQEIVEFGESASNLSNWKDIIKQ